MKSEQNFRVTYDGSALQAHEMDIRDLAPALMAMADLLKAANHALHGDKADVKVSVKANFKASSFGIDMVFFQDIMTQLTELLSGKEASATANAIQILSGIGIVGTGGVFGFLRWLRGRKIAHADAKESRFIIETDDGDTYDLSPEEWRLIKDKSVRREIENVLKPLSTEGIDSFYTGLKDAPSIAISSAERHWFIANQDNEDIVTDSTAQRMLLIESLAFKEGNKWRLSDGTQTFHAEMEDEHFKRSIDNGLARFGKGDVLIVDLRVIQSVANGELKNRYIVERVIEHREPLQKSLL